MTSACSGALEISLSVLSNPGQNILVPRPGFPLYRCLVDARGVETRYYRLKVRPRHHMVWGGSRLTFDLILVRISDLWQCHLTFDPPSAGVLLGGGPGGLGAAG